ncbi:MAG TPA: DUF4258 domain-containing protein [Candidatus Thermoplasmatota archaeon]|nr:DUF4258 domain-containing protein [Candidatus Thermoplasmatota archaeon]
MRILFSRHARVRMAERGISATEVRQAILKGTKRRQDDRIVASFRYFEVVYRREDDLVFVITVQPRW